MNIPREVMSEANKRGLGAVATGGGFDFVCRTITTEHLTCQMTLSGKDGESPKGLDEPCEVGVAFHSSGYLSVGLCFNNVPDALDFMARTRGIFCLPDMYASGKKQEQGLLWV